MTPIRLTGTVLLVATALALGCGAALDDSPVPAAAAESQNPPAPSATPNEPPEGTEGSAPSTPQGDSPGSKQPGEVTFAFWNLENLFDTRDDPTNRGDDEYLPARGWDDARYGRKLEHLREAIAKLDADLLGVCEVENLRVLEDLIAAPPLASLGYSIAHLDTPDKRGIDMALLYRAPFDLAKIDRAVHLWEIDLGEGVPKTRGILEVNLVAKEQPLVVLVHHWPSRSGGEERSRPHRIAAAKTAKRIVNARLDAAKSAGREGDILLIGDFNDDPYNASLVEHLEAVRGKFALTGSRGAYRLFNPTWSFLATPDLGTLYYSSGWNAFDQAIVSRGMLDTRGFSYVEGSLAVQGGDELRNLNHPAHPPRWFRKYKGNWDEGFSDHFAIFGRLQIHESDAQ